MRVKLPAMGDVIKAAPKHGARKRHSGLNKEAVPLRCNADNRGRRRDVEKMTAEEYHTTLLTVVVVVVGVVVVPNVRAMRHVRYSILHYYQ